MHQYKNPTKNQKNHKIYLKVIKNGMLNKVRILMHQNNHINHQITLIIDLNQKQTKDIISIILNSVVKIAKAIKMQTNLNINLLWNLIVLNLLKKINIQILWMKKQKIKVTPIIKMMNLSYKNPIKLNKFINKFNNQINKYKCKIQNNWKKKLVTSNIFQLL